MMRRLVSAALLALLAVAPQAWGDFIPWSYSSSVVTTGGWATWNPFPPPVTSPLPPFNSLIAIPDDVTAFNSVSQQAVFAGAQGQATGSATVTGFTLQGYLGPQADLFSGRFNPTDSTFSLSMTLTDAASKASGTVAFQGNLSGVVGNPLSVGFTGPTTQTLTLGSDRYTVSVTPLTLPPASFLPPNGLGYSTPQVFSVQVAVSEVPEPSTLALAGLGARLAAPARETLCTCFDPEIPVNIYELGLIYDIVIEPTRAVGLRMTLTSPGCPVAGSLPGEVEGKVRRVPGVTAAKVDLVWDPPWDKDRMSEAAKLQLGMDDY